MRLDVVDVTFRRYVDQGTGEYYESIDRMANAAMAYLARARRDFVIFVETDTWQSMVSRIIGRVRDRGTLTILQIHSHGSPGRMFSGRLTARSVRENEAIFRQLTPYFAPEGQIYLKGCHTGEDPSLSEALAAAIRRPVTAGVQLQRTGSSTDVFYGMTDTAYPNRIHELNRDDIPRRRSE